MYVKLKPPSLELNTFSTSKLLLFCLTIEMTLSITMFKFYSRGRDITFYIFRTTTYSLLQIFRFKDHSHESLLLYH